MKIKEKIRKLIKQDINNGIEEIKKISVIKNLFIFLSGVLFTCLLQMIVYNVDPSNYVGEKLNQYFRKNIAKELGCEDSQNIDIVHIKKYAQEPLSDKNSIFVIGELSNEENIGNQVFVAVFEVGERKLWDFVINTNAEYKISDFFVTTTYNEYEMNFQNINFVDLDEDGTDEVIIDFKSNYATTIANYTIILTNDNKRWLIMTPDFENLQVELEMIDRNYRVVLYETVFHNSKSEEDIVIYGLSRGGILDFYENRIYGFIDFCYKIPVLKLEQAMMDIDTYAYCMLRLEGKDLVRDNSWNDGDVLVDRSLSFEEVYDYMGKVINGVTFYGEP